MPRHPLQGQKFTRTLIIGLGSTGLKILQSFQHLWVERFNKVSNNLVKLINIETDQNNVYKSTYEGSMITQIIVDMNRATYQEIVRQILNKGFPLHNSDRNYVPWEWNWTSKVNWNKIVGFAGQSGAGGLRAGGRVLLWGNNKNNSTTANELVDVINKTRRDEWRPLIDINNRKELVRDLGYLDQDWAINNDDNPEFSYKHNVYITGSLTGGTCSGMFLDIAYLMKNIFQDGLNETIGYFLIPPVNYSNINFNISVDEKSANANTLGSLYELEKEMLEALSANQRYTSYPFDNVYLIAPEYGKNDRNFIFNDLDGLIDMCALRLFSCALGLQEKLPARLVDSRAIITTGYMHTFGIGAILYPKFTLVQTAKNELIRNFCYRLINSAEYFNSIGERRIISAQLNNIEKYSKELADKYSKEIFKKLKSKPANNVQDVEDVVNEWLGRLGDKTFDKVQFINQFMERNGYFYSMMQNNLDKTYQELKNEIFKDLVEDLRNTTNLIYQKIKLNALEKELLNIHKLLDYQKVNDFKEDIRTDVEHIYRTYTKKSYYVDRYDLTKSLIYLLYEKFISYNANLIIEKLIEYIKDCKLKNEQAIENISTLSENYNKNFEYFYKRLDDNPNFAPVCKIYKLSKDEDYLNLKQSLPDKQTISIEKEEMIYPTWNTFNPEITPELFLESIFNSNFKIFEKANENIRKKLNIEIRKYLHPENGEQFSIIKKIKNDVNRIRYEANFEQVITGFCQLNNYRPPTQHTCRFLISNESLEELNSIIYDFELGSQPFQNPLIEDMVIYSADKLTMKIDNLMKFEVLKDCLINKPPAVTNYSDYEWTRLRLVYDEYEEIGPIYYPLLEPKKKQKIEEFFKFISYFWFARSLENGVIKFNKLSNPNYPVPETFILDKLEFINDGLYIDKNSGEIHIGFRVPSSGTKYLINIQKYSRLDLNQLCKHREAFNALSDFVKKFLIINPFDQRNNFISQLDKYYKEEIVNTIDNTETEYLRLELFGANYKGGENFDYSENNNCIIANIIREYL